jgi:hypothetical protein
LNREKLIFAIRGSDSLVEAKTTLAEYVRGVDSGKSILKFIVIIDVKHCVEVEK